GPNQLIVSRVENCGNPERLSESKQTSVGGVYPRPPLAYRERGGINPATLPWFRRAGFAAKFKERHYTISWKFLGMEVLPPERHPS
ncbi:MAG: hypothetical protein V2B18_22430, partial [Pseudomonadota bacterium]